MGARPPLPRSAHRLVVFTLDASRCADRSATRIVDDAVASTVARIEAGPGGADHRFAAVIYGSEQVRVIPVGAPRPWDLRVPCSGPARTDGATVALADLAHQFLGAAPHGLPGSVDALALVSTGARIVRPDDLRILIAATDDLTDLADEWWLRLVELRSRRRHVVLLR
jgi:hypothetical protein